MDLNSLNVVGHCTKDSEIKFTSGNICICSFSIAVNRYSYSEKKEEVNFFNCVMFGKTAEQIGKYLTKGKRIAISGELQQQRYTDKEGNKKDSIKIICSKVQLLDGNKKENENESNEQKQLVEKVFQSNEDDCPF